MSRVDEFGGGKGKSNLLSGSKKILNSSFAVGTSGTNARFQGSTTHVTLLKQVNRI